MTVGNRILQLTTSRLTGNKEQLAHAEGLLPIAARNAVERAQSRLRNAATTLSGISGRRLHPQLTRLDMTLKAIADAASNRISRQRSLLDSRQTLLEALSPVATLKRGYSITRVDGHAVTSADSIRTGSIIETTLADGKVISTATAVETSSGNR